MRLKFAMVLTIAFLSASVAARADQIFTLTNVTFAGGGALTGTFTTNDARTMVNSYDIVASAAGSFAGYEYTPAHSVITASVLPQFFQIDSTGSIDELRLYFSSPLTASGAQISTNSSYEHEPSGGNRFPSGSVVGGSAVAVTPEPSSLVLLGTGLLGVVGVLRKRLA